MLKMSKFNKCQERIVSFPTGQEFPFLDKILFVFFTSYPRAPEAYVLVPKSVQKFSFERSK